MSIINDALKKTQNTLFSKEKNLTNNTPPSESSSWKSPAKGNDRSSLLAIAIISIGFAGCLGVIIFLLRPVSHAPLDQISVSEEFPVETSAKAPVIKTSEGLPGLTLNGISTIEGEHLAVINNKIVHEGDPIGDKKVLSIEADAVKIYDNGNVLILKITE